MAKGMPGMLGDLPDAVTGTDLPSEGARKNTGNFFKAIFGRDDADFDEEEYYEKYGQYDPFNNKEE